MKKELKIYLLQVWKNDAITAQDFRKVAELADVNIGVNISVEGEECDALPIIDEKRTYALPRDAKTAILGALYSGELTADTLHTIAKAVGVRLALIVNVESQECADKLRQVLKMEY